MQNSKVLTTLGLTLFLAVLLLMGCGGQPPEEVAQKFIKVEEVSEIQALVTKLAWEKIGNNVDMDETKDIFGKLIVGESTITGEIATVELTSPEGETGDFLMRKEDGDWKIYGLQSEIGGSNFTIDFEHPEESTGELFKALGPAMGEAMKGVKKSLDSFVEGMGEGIKTN